MLQGGSMESDKAENISVGGWNYFLELTKKKKQYLKVYLELTVQKAPNVTYGHYFSFPKIVNL